MKFGRRNGIWEYYLTGKSVDVVPLQLYKGITFPLEIAEEVYKEYSAQFGTQQSLERLNERGGFEAAEVITLLYDRILRLNAQS